MATLDDHPQLEITSRAQWRRWLQREHARSSGVWLVAWKAADAKRHVPYRDQVEEALCFGWIDSRPRALDAQRSMRLFTPRKARSGWSAVNKKLVAQLIADGRMMAAGLAAVEAAKANGSWQALDTVESGTIPPDLARALRANAKAARHFDAFPPGSRKIIVGWIALAKTAPTREKRIAETVRLAQDNLRANHWRQPGDKR